jgi:hypothetical protein
MAGPLELLQTTTGYSIAVRPRNSVLDVDGKT